VKTDYSTGLSGFKKFKPKDMASQIVKRCLIMTALVTVSLCTLSQNNVPIGMHYQAVARNSAGNELVNTKIEVRFSIMSGDPLSSPIFMEVHQNVITNKFGIFTLVIGEGVPTGGLSTKSLAEVKWDEANHWLKVEVKFDTNAEFCDMGTMKFYAVPYALYAKKSLEPGPAGPKGDPGEKGLQGDPASDNQTLSVVNVDGTDYLAIDGGNQVKISNIEKDGDITNEIQDLNYNISTHLLQLTKSALGTVDLTELKNDADADPANEIQDLKVTNDKLTITGKTSPTEINLGVYRDNTDSQQLSYSGANNTLSITGGNNVTLGILTAFRAKKTLATSAPLPMASVDFIPDNIEYNDGSGLNETTGEFTATYTGIYTFDIKYVAPSSGDGRMVMLYKNGNLYETLGSNISAGTTLFRTVTFKLLATDKIKMVINTGTATDIGTGTFSGYKVY